MRRETRPHATLLATGLFVAGVMCGGLAGRAAVARAQDPYAHLDLFARVLTTIQDDYLEPLTTEQLVDAAIRGMVEELDSQSRWLDSDALEELRDDAAGTTTGLGIEVARNGDTIEIVRVLPDSPARRDGLREGDRIVAVDGEALQGLDMGEIRARFDGDRGVPTELTVIRDGESESQVIHTVRDKVHRETAHGTMLPERVAYVRLAQFQEGSARDVLAEVEHLAASVGGIGKLQGLVLDVRDNPGGLLTEAVAVTDLFLDEGVIVSTRGRDGAEEEVHRASSGGLPTDLRVIVLINGISASASEIVAGALQDTGRGTLVGEHTYGKGTVQQVYLHASPSEAALKLTVGQYYTPSGEPVAPAEGRKPDHEVVYPRNQTRSERLRDRLSKLEIEATERDELVRLLDALPTEPSPRPLIAWDRPIEDRYARDPQIQKALELLNR